MTTTAVSDSKKMSKMIMMKVAVTIMVVMVTIENMGDSER